MGGALDAAGGVPGGPREASGARRGEGRGGAAMTVTTGPVLAARWTVHGPSGRTPSGRLLPTVMASGMSFDDAVRILRSPGTLKYNTCVTAVRAADYRNVSGPSWDPTGIYRMVLQGSTLTIQKSEGTEWVTASLEPPSEGSAPSEPSGVANEITTETRSILFMDLAGWSKLKPAQLASYLEKALPKVARLVKGFDGKHINTWGDALVATFGSAKEASECALDVRDFFRRASEADGVPQGLVPRIALHLGEVIIAYNPLVSRADIFGDAVHLAARLEPVTAKGDVYCTVEFAKALEAIKGLAATAHSLGVVELPKNFGSVEVFAVTGPNERAPVALPVQAVLVESVSASAPEPPLGDEETGALLGIMFQNLPGASTSLTYEEIIKRTNPRVSREAVKRVIQRAAPKGSGWGWTVTLVGEATVTLEYEQPLAAVVSDVRERRGW